MEEFDLSAILIKKKDNSSLYQIYAMHKKKKGYLPACDDAYDLERLTRSIGMIFIAGNLKIDIQLASSVFGPDKDELMRLKEIYKKN